LRSWDLIRKPPRLTVRAHAKVNLDLRVLGVRADGYHELRTVFQTIEMHDTLVCGETPGPFTLKCRTPGVPLDDENLVWKAAAALWTALGRAGGVRDTLIHIDKRIPVQAGLGGGSADAAAALMALGRLWGGAPITLLREVGATLGADVPFFLSGGTALGLGRGEEIYPLVDLPPHFVVIVRPLFGVSTAEAYAWYDEDRSAGFRENREIQQLPVPWPSRAAQMINDLEPPVMRPAAGAGGDGGRHVGQRLSRIRSVPEPRRRRAGCQAAVAKRREGPGDADIDPRGARAPGSSGCPKDIIPIDLSFCDWPLGPLLGRGQAVRRGTLDPVFGGSNPPAPTMHPLVCS
jgi:4-diphosphocytidyl-2-C-methyl-D-erythritol kinase